MTARLVAGLDLGSTGVKVLVADEYGAELLVRQYPTPWRDGRGGTTDLDADVLVATLTRLLHDVADDIRALLPDRDAGVEAIAISGMGETGFLLDVDGVAVAPAFAWFDPRGHELIAALPEDLRAEFAGRTGLPIGAQVSVAKLLHLRDNGLEPGIPEEADAG